MWSELSDLEIKHWVCLGWSSSTWQHGPPPESERKTWDELSDEEKVAAHALKSGMLIPRDNKLHDPLWAKDSFDGARHFDGSKKLWHELREVDQSNWKVLGWEMTSWNEGRILYTKYTDVDALKGSIAQNLESGARSAPASRVSTLHALSAVDSFRFRLLRLHSELNSTQGQTRPLTTSGGPSYPPRNKQQRRPLDTLSLVGTQTPRAVSRVPFTDSLNSSRGSRWRWPSRLWPAWFIQCI